MRTKLIPRCEACGGVSCGPCLPQLGERVKDGVAALAMHGNLENGPLEARGPMNIKLSQRNWATTKRQRMVLVGANAEAFLEAMTAPPLPNERLVEAIRKHRSLVG